MPDTPLVYIRYTVAVNRAQRQLKVLSDLSEYIRVARPHLEIMLRIWKKLTPKATGRLAEGYFGTMEPHKPKVGMLRLEIQNRDPRTSLIRWLIEGTLRGRPGGRAKTIHPVRRKAMKFEAYGKTVFARKVRLVGMKPSELQKAPQQTKDQVEVLRRAIQTKVAEAATRTR